MRARSLNFIFVTLVVAAIALTLGSALLLRCAVCMGIMLLLSLISLALARASAKISVSGGNITVTRRQKVQSEVTLSFKSVLPLGSVAFIADSGASLHFGCFPFKKYQKSLITPTPHVGVFERGNGRLLMTDIFNLFVFSKHVNMGGAKITVLPASFKTDAPENRSGEAGLGEIRYEDDAEEPSGIREWVDGDLLKRVHWKLTVKNYDTVNESFTPIVKTYQEAARPDILIIPELSRVAAPIDPAFIKDGICEATLSLCKAIILGGDSVNLLLLQNEAREIKASGAEGLNEISLALTHASFDGVTPFETSVNEAMRRAGVTSTVVFVISRLDERRADALMRLRTFSGMNVELMRVSYSSNDNDDIIQARLEEGGVNVKRARLKIGEAVR